jgi:hypothetical protein
MTRTAQDAPPLVDAWAWWEARRLRYNLALAAAGWAAYGLMLLVLLAAGRQPWIDWRGGLAMTLFLGTLYLLLMGAANVCYLAGVALEAWMRPADPARYRARAYRLGLLGSIALPFAVPAINLAMVIGPAG